MMIDTVRAAAPTPPAAHAHPGDRYRRVFLRFHGTALLLITVTSVVAATVGWRTGTGPWSVMRDDDLGYIGFYQAYLLMFVIGLVLWIGSTRPRPRVWDVVGLLAHLPPLSINFLARDDVLASAGSGVATVSIALHSTFIVLEAVAIAWKASWWPARDPGTGRTRR